MDKVQSFRPPLPDIRSSYISSLVGHVRACLDQTGRTSLQLGVHRAQVILEYPLKIEPIFFLNTIEIRVLLRGRTHTPQVKNMYDSMDRCCTCITIMELIAINYVYYFVVLRGFVTLAPEFLIT